MQYAALDGLVEVGAQSGSPVPPVLTNAIGINSLPFRLKALSRIGDFGPAARDVVPWLDSLMRDATNQLAGQAMRVMAEILADPSEYIPVFSERLLNTNLAPDAAFALARAGSTGVAPLLRAVTNPSPRIQRAAGLALNAKFRKPPPNATPVHRGSQFSFLSASFDVRYRLFPQAALPRQATILLVEQTLDHPDPAVRLEIVRFLSRCGQNGAVGLSRAAVDENENVRQAAEAALGASQVQVHEGALIRGPRDRKAIALVFTGHQFAEGGETILGALASHRARASFFHR